MVKIVEIDTLKKNMLHRLISLTRKHILVKRKKQIETEYIYSCSIIKRNKVTSTLNIRTNNKYNT